MILHDKDGNQIHLEDGDGKHAVMQASKTSEDGKREVVIEYCEHGVSLILMGEDLDMPFATALAETYLTYDKALLYKKEGE